MKYAEARPQIRSGDLLAWRHEGWGSWKDIKVQLVRIVSRSEYSHVGTACVMEGRCFVLEAVKPLVRMFPLRKLTPFYWIPLGAAWGPEARRFAFSKIGEPYSERDAVLAFLGRLKVGANREWECAEYSHGNAAKDGIDLGDRAVPTDLVQAAQRRPEAKLIYVEG